MGNCKIQSVRGIGFGFACDVQVFQSQVQKLPLIFGLEGKAGQWITKNFQIWQPVHGPPVCCWQGWRKRRAGHGFRIGGSCGKHGGAAQFVRGRQPGCLPKQIQDSRGTLGLATSRSWLEDVKLLPGTGQGHIEQVKIFTGVIGNFLIKGLAQLLSPSADQAKALSLGDTCTLRSFSRKAQIWHDDHRGFQPLGFVDGHNAHGIHIFWHGDLFCVALGLPVFQKRGKRCQPLFFRTVYYFHEAAQKSTGLRKTGFHVQQGIPFQDSIVGSH